MRNERPVYLAVIVMMSVGSLAMAIALSAPTIRRILPVTTVTEPCPCASDPFDDSRFDDGQTRKKRVAFVRKRIKSTVTVYVDNYTPKKGLTDSSGTGVIIDNDGTVLTAYHVVDDAQFISIGFLELDKDEDIVETRYIPMYVDTYLKDIDSAILKPMHQETGVPPPMRIDMGWEAEIGDVLWHFGSTTEWSQGRVMNTGFKHLIAPIKEECVTLRADTDYGDSGGPVVTSKGELVGIVLTLSTGTKKSAHFMPITTIIDKLSLSCH